MYAGSGRCWQARAEVGCSMHPPAASLCYVYAMLCAGPPLQVLVMEWIDGIRCTDVEAIKASGLDLPAFIRTGGWAGAVWCGVVWRCGVVAVLCCAAPLGWPPGGWVVASSASLECQARLGFPGQAGRPHAHPTQTCTRMCVCCHPPQAWCRACASCWSLASSTATLTQVRLRD